MYVNIFAALDSDGIQCKFGWCMMEALLHLLDLPYTVMTVKNDYCDAYVCDF